MNRLNLALGLFIPTFFLITSCSRATSSTSGSLDSTNSNSLNITAPSSTTQGNCNSLKLSVSNPINSSYILQSDLTVQISQSGAAVFYSDSECTTKISSFVIPQGSSTKTFYFLDSSVEKLTLSASSSLSASATASATASVNVTQLTANLVFGQSDFTTNLNTIYGSSSLGTVYSTGSQFFVTNTGSSNIFIWNSIPTSMNQLPDFILGPILGTGTPVANLSSPQSVMGDGTRLVVADTANNRVLIWNTLPTSSSTIPDVVIGQPSMTSVTANSGGINAATLSAPQYAAIFNGSLFVADTGNNRTLIWNSIPTSTGTAANVVLGQPNMASNTANNGGVSGSSLSSPRGLTVASGKLFVADYTNHRVLGWSSIPSSSATAANFVLGQTSLTAATSATTATTLKYPSTVTSQGSDLFVADTGNNRVLIWTSIPSSSTVAANYAVGQAAVTSGGTANEGSTAAANTLSAPLSAFSDGSNFFVSDKGNFRILSYSGVPTSSGASATLALRQPNLTSNLTLNPNGLDASHFIAPFSASPFKGKLYVSDQTANRILVWNSIPKENQAPADFVLGQTSMSSGAVNQGATVSSSTLSNPRRVIGVTNNATQTDELIVADWANQRVLIWNPIPTSTDVPATVVIGQSSMTTNAAATTSTGLRSPNDVFSDGNILIVADSSNNRVLIWNSIPTSNGTPASVVLGQPDFISMTANNGGLSAASLNVPQGVAYDGTRLYVADLNNNRILIWNSLPTTNQKPADIVLGQPNMTSNTANNGGISNASIYNPNAIITEGAKVFVMDRINQRVLVWNTTPIANFTPADYAIGQLNFTIGAAQQMGAASFSDAFFLGIDNSISPAELYTADGYSARVLRFQLPN